MITDGDKELLRRNWRAAYPADNSGKGIICPLCGSGSGKHGTGISEIKGEPGLLYCFGCGFKGDVIGLYCREHGLDPRTDFKRACEDLATKTGLALSPDVHARVQKKASAVTSRENGRSCCRVPSKNDEKKKLSEGILKPGIYAEGMVSGDIDDYLKRRGLSKETLKVFNILSSRKWRHPKFRGGNYRPVVIIPTSDESYLARDIRPEDQMTPIEYNTRKAKVGKVHIFNENALGMYETIIAVEGEIDAMSVYEAGFKNVVGTGSANFHDLFVKALRRVETKPRCIILALDNEDKPQVRAAFEKYRAGIESLGVAVVDGHSLSAPAKDANDLLCSDKQRLIDNINSLMAQAAVAKIPVGHTEKPSEVTVKERLPGCPIELNIPKGWALTPRGVFDDDNHVASFTPVIPVKIVDHKATGAVKYILSALVNGRWQNIVCDAAVIADNSKALTLAERGVQVFSETAKYLVRYLNLTIAENQELIPRVTEYSRPGWSDDLTSFALPDFDGCFMPTLTDVYSTRGDLDCWLDKAREIRAFKNPVGRIMLALAFAAPLMPVLDIRTFLTYVWGDSLAGKSACQKFALSAFGNPDKMMATFNATKNGIEAAAVRSNNIALMIDEKQVTDEKINLVKLIYALSGERNRERMDKTLEKRPTVNWRMPILASGEDRLLTESVEKGAYNRTLELRLESGEKIFADAEEAGAVHNFVKRHHGLAGRKYLEALIKESAVNFMNVRHVYNTFYDGLRQYCAVYSPEHVTDAALVSTADYLSGVWLFDGDEDDRSGQESSLELGRRVIERQMPMECLQESYRGAQEILSWISAERYHFLGDHLNPAVERSIPVKDPIFGTLQWSEDDGERTISKCTVIVSQLKAMLRKKNYPVEKVIRDLRAQKFFVGGEEDKPTRQRIKVANGTKRVEIVTIPDIYVRNLFEIF